MAEVLEFDAAGVGVVLRSDGILVYRYEMEDVDGAQAVATLSAAEERLVAAQMPLPRPTLVHMGPVSKLSREAREVFATSELNARLSSKVALIATNIISRVIGNFFIAFDRTPRPVRLFPDEASAVAWLLDADAT